ncbi:sensor histidine kinase, partial [Rubrivirga sp.]|uniref:sensor histidine kinase n=1 Tax=Rubrivirga sp. TaxID=1885344 RepID=UPI003C70C7B2
FGRTYPGLEVVLDLDATGRRWPVPVQHAIVRIAQEALSNAGRHAQADRITVSLIEDEGQAVLEVADDGVGFDDHVRDVDHVRGGHFGLAGLRERAEALSGTVEITSAPGDGTRISARLPLKAPKGRRWLGLMG